MARDEDNIHFYLAGNVQYWMFYTPEVLYSYNHDILSRSAEKNPRMRWVSLSVDSVRKPAILLFNVRVSYLM